MIITIKAPYMSMITSIFAPQIFIITAIDIRKLFSIITASHCDHFINKITSVHELICRVNAHSSIREDTYHLICKTTMISYTAALEGLLIT